MKHILGMLMVVAAVVMLSFSAMARGVNEMLVAADGTGVTVYTQSNGKQKAGILYNGTDYSLSLKPQKGLYQCWLTRDYSVWVNTGKATDQLPDGWQMYSTNPIELEEQMPCSVFLAEVIEQDAPMYTSPAHKVLTARHAPGTLVLVCGEFGSDYYVAFDSVYNFISYSYSGFMPKTSLKKVKDLTYGQLNDRSWQAFMDEAEVKAVHTGGGVMMTSGSATGFCDTSGITLKDGQRVCVIAEIGDWVQLANGGFIEKRFLDQQGDHSKNDAMVKSSKPLNRLNVRYQADKDSNVVCKLCAGVTVQLVQHTDEWATIVVTGENGGLSFAGAVQMDYLEPEQKTVGNGCTRVKLLEKLELCRDRMKKSAYDRTDEILPAGTELTVIGVMTNEYPSDNADWVLCMTEDGHLIELQDVGILSPIEGSGLTVKATSRVKMRAVPGQEAQVLASIPKDGKAEVLLRQEGWTIVRYKDQVGYVMSRYLKFP